VPQIAKIERPNEAPRFVRFCWCCRELGWAVPTGRVGQGGVELFPDPELGVVLAVKSPQEALALPPRCEDCHRRALAGLPLGRRIDG
jgi:hypothetical protein